jgi:hypothetical protein
MKVVPVGRIGQLTNLGLARFWAILPILVRAELTVLYVWYLIDLFKKTGDPEIGFFVLALGGLCVLALVVVILATYGHFVRWYARSLLRYVALRWPVIGKSAAKRRRRRAKRRKLRGWRDNWIQRDTEIWRKVAEGAPTAGSLLPFILANVLIIVLVAAIGKWHDDQGLLGYTQRFVEKIIGLTGLGK